METSSLPILWPTPSIFRLALLFLRVNIISIGFNLYQTRCYANHNSTHYYHCALSSCSNISNISYPFRVDTDPEPCGDHSLSISCEENKTLPVLYWNSGRYRVQSINYTIQTIRVVDLEVFKYNCSFIPSYSLDSRNYFSTSRTTDVRVFLQLFGYSMIGWVECENIPVNFSSLTYLDTSACDINLTPCRPYSYQYSYYIWGSGAILAADLEDGCRIRFMTPVPQLSMTEESSTLCLRIHGLVNGFELSWIIDGTVVRESPDFPWYDDLYYHWYNDFSGKLYCLCGCCHYSSWRPCVFLDSITKGRGRMYGDGTMKEDWFETYLAPDHSVKIFNALMTAVALIVSLIIAKITIGIPCVIVFLIYKWGRRHLSMYHNIEEFLQSNNIMPIRYSYSDIRKMAKGFKDKLGAGGFGSVYKGKLRSGRLVAIKLLGETKSTNGQDFINEVATIGRIHHVNVVRLVGFCAERSKRALVYDFMPNGSLDKYIFSQGGFNSIDCKKMCEISVGVASGIEYLHRGCNMQILHFDIKPHNILLDENFAPKVSDFGLARLCPLDNITVSLTAARGTMGYMAPELFYKNIGGVSYKADVYSFGVLLMEIASRRKSLNADAEHTSQIYFPSWAFDQITEGKDIEMENATEEESKIRKKMIIVALWCIQLKPSDRPSMKKVKEMLEGDFESLEMPPKPFLCPQEKATDGVGEKSSSALMLPTTLSDYDDSSETKQFLNAN